MTCLFLIGAMKANGVLIVRRTSTKKRQCSSQNVFNDTNNNRLTTNVKCLSHNSTPVRRVQKCCIRKLKTDQETSPTERVRSMIDMTMFFCVRSSAHTLRTLESCDRLPAILKICVTIYIQLKISRTWRREGEEKKHNKKGKMRHLESH